MVAVAEQSEVKPGVYRMSFAEYMRIEAVNWHTLEPYRISAKSARHSMLRPRDATESMKIGEALHCAVLEPHRFCTEYSAMPSFDGHPNSKIYKEAKAAWMNEHGAEVTLTREEYHECKTMGEAVAAHPVASRIMLGKGRNEIVVVWIDKETGILCKGRIDRLCYAPALTIFPSSDLKPSDQVLVMADVKTSRKPLPGPREFEGEIARYGYHGQLAWYHDGLQAIEPAPVVPVIVAVQNEAPFEVAVYRFDETELEKGQKLCRRLLTQHLTCTQQKDWPGACESIVSVQLPAWADEPGLE